MAKTKTQAKSKKRQSRDKETPSQLYELAISALETSEPEKALEYAQRLLALVQPSTATAPAAPSREALPALNLLGEICVELGEIEDAVSYFILAVQGDPAGEIPEAQGGGSEKFLWLAQLCEAGGAESIGWYEKGVAVLKSEIDALEGGRPADDEVGLLLEEKRRKLATALCGIVDVYMTDLSWEADAELRCENYITEALLLAPDSAEVLQTLASVRLSQVQLDAAQSALRRSTDLWKDLDPEDDLVPDFPTRVSLARLLMEAEMEHEAMEVLERLALEDDQSVEACYLGGWCLYLLGEKRKRVQSNGVNGHDTATGAGEIDEVMDAMKASRSWLLNTLKLYQLLDYEDERLKEHTAELVQELNKILGPVPEGNNADDEEEEEEDWVEEDGSDDENEDAEMAGT